MRYYYCELNKQGNDMAALFWDWGGLINNFMEILKDTDYNVGCPEEEEIVLSYIYEYSGGDCVVIPENDVKTFLNSREGKKYPALDRLYKQTVRYCKHKNKKRAAEYKHMKDMLTPSEFEDWKKHSGF